MDLPSIKKKVSRALKVCGHDYGLVECAVIEV